MSKKISDLPNASETNEIDIIEIEQGGVSKKASLSYIIDLAFGRSQYLLSGPSYGYKDIESSNFTVSLPVGTTLPDSVIVTPDDMSDGTFTPTSVTLSSILTSATFTYTPSSVGTKTISTTNNGNLSNPNGLTYTVTLSPPNLATTFILSGSDVGVVGLPSVFTVELPTDTTVAGVVIITPNDGGGGGTFSPVTVALTASVQSATFTYTGDSVGIKTIDVTNNGGLDNPSGVTHTVVSAVGPDDVDGIYAWFKSDSLVLNDGDNVTLWSDSSINGHFLEQNMALIPTGIPPVFKVDIINGKPVIRFDGEHTFMSSDYLNISYPDTIFVVAKQTSKTTNGILLYGWGDDPQLMNLMISTGYYQIGDATAGNDHYYNDTTDHSGAFHIFRFESFGPNAKGFVDGTLTVSGALGLMGSYAQIYGSDTVNFLAGDIAEIIYYNNALPPIGAGPLSEGDKIIIENYLYTRYGLPGAVPIVPGPTNVAGLLFWLKADAISQMDGTEITTWTDASGNGRNFTSATGPTFRTNIVNGKPAARFDGTQNVQKNGAWGDIYPLGGVQQPYTIIIAANVTSGGRLWYSIPYPKNEITVGPTSLDMVSDPGTTLSDGINHQGAWHVFTAVFTGGGDSKGYVDRTETCSGDAGFGSFANLLIGLSLVGDIAEVIVYPRVLTTDEQTEIELYLKTKYGTP